nr:hypothetical protein [Morchella crassipes]
MQIVGGKGGSENRDNNTLKLISFQKSDAIRIRNLLDANSPEIKIPYNLTLSFSDSEKLEDWERERENRNLGMLRDQVLPEIETILQNFAENLTTKGRKNLIKSIFKRRNKAGSKINFPKSTKLSLRNSNQRQPFQSTFLNPKIS